MKGILNLFFFFLIFSLLYFTSHGSAYAALVGADGKTFQQRRQAWLSSMPDPGTLSSTNDPLELERRIELYLFGWLERCAIDTNWKDKCKGVVVTETIQRMATRGYWINPGPKQQKGYTIIIPLKYYAASPYQGQDKADVISSAANDSVLKWYRDFVIGQEQVFSDGQPNKEIAGAVGAYLYTAYYDRTVQFDVFACPGSTGNCLGTHWETFSYPASKGGSGKTFTLGSGPYNAYELMRDWIMSRLDGWYARVDSPFGMREWDSNNYHRQQPHMMSLLEKFAPDASIQKRGKMTMDISILDALMDFSANGWGGTRGRMDYKHLSRSPVFAFYEYFGLTSANGDQGEWDIAAQYAVNREPSDLLISLSKFDEAWRFHREYNEQLNNEPGAGKWTYLTDSYNLGSSKGQQRQGWTAVVRGSGTTSAMRFIINDNSVEPPETQETNHQGINGRQFRNALFVDGGKPLYFWEFSVDGAGWDEESSEIGWKFMRLGSVFVAYQISGNYAGVELGEEGVDYSSYTAFKNAVKGSASISSTGFTTSKGIRIGKGDFCGLGSPGDCTFPFETMETESSSGKLIDWSAETMTVSKANRTCRYNFNNWTYSGDCGASGGPPPPSPTGTTNTPTPTKKPTPTGTNIQADLDKDGDVDIFDYNILIENFGNSNCGNIADIDGNCKVDIFDYNLLVENFG